MDLDGTSLLVSLLIGSIGFVLLVYGKKQSRFPQMLTGLLLLAYPYFVPNVIVMAVIAVVLLGAMTIAVRLGW